MKISCTITFKKEFLFSPLPRKKRLEVNETERERW